jgi:hypothetical protein
MSLHAEPMPDDYTQQAFLYGPLLLAGVLTTEVLPANLVVGAMGPDFKKHAPPATPELHGSKEDPRQWIHKSSEPLTFAASGSVTLIPFHTVGAGRPYSVYWKLA